MRDGVTERLREKANLSIPLSLRLSILPSPRLRQVHEAAEAVEDVDLHREEFGLVDLA